MIFAIEGPDCAGKSTLFAELQSYVSAKFVWLPTPLKITEEVILRELEVWEALYDTTKTYICDRHVIITDRVYAAYYKRLQLRPSWLEAELRIIYLRVDEQELVRRHKIRGETIQDITRYTEVCQLYDATIFNTQHIIHNKLATTMEWINAMRQRN